jgi:uncharacterized protein YegL
MNPNTVIPVGLDEIEVQNTAVDDLESENVYLADLLIDSSGSMQPFEGAMVDALTNFKESMLKTKEHDANEMLVSRINFCGKNITIGGFKKVEDLDLAYRASGMTPMYNAIIKAKEELMQYMQHLRNRGMTVRATVGIFSDGDETTSPSKFGEAKAAIAELQAAEVNTVFIVFGTDRQVVRQRALDLGFKDNLILDAGDTGHTLRAAFDTFSKSLSSHSKNVGSQFAI